MEKVAMLLAVFVDDLKREGGFSVPASRLYFSKKDTAKDSELTFSNQNEESKAYHQGDSAYVIMFDPKDDSLKKTQKFISKLKRHGISELQIKECMVGNRQGIAIDVTSVLVDEKPLTNFYLNPQLDDTMARRHFVALCATFLAGGGLFAGMHAATEAVKEYRNPNPDPEKSSAKWRSLLLEGLAGGAALGVGGVAGGLSLDAPEGSAEKDTTPHPVYEHPIAYLTPELSRGAYDQLMKYHADIVIDYRASVAR